MDLDQRELIETIKSILKGNLSVDIEQVTEFGPNETIKLTVSFDGEIIDEVSCSLPNCE